MPLPKTEGCGCIQWWDKAQQEQGPSYSLLGLSSLSLVPITALLILHCVGTGTVQEFQKPCQSLLLLFDYSKSFYPYKCLVVCHYLERFYCFVSVKVSCSPGWFRSHNTVKDDFEVLVLSLFPKYGSHSPVSPQPVLCDAGIKPRACSHKASTLPTEL